MEDSTKSINQENLVKSGTKKTSKKKMFCLGCIGIFVLFIVIVFAFSSQKQGSQSNQDNSIKTSQNVEAIVVDIKEFLNDYKTNVLSAEDKYKGKIIKTTGKIDDISQGIFGGYYILVRGDAFTIESIRCNGDKEQFVKLSKGNQVTIQGKVGSASVGTTDLDNCKVQ